MRTFFAVIGVVLMSVPAVAQTPASAVPGPPSDATILSAGWNALANGRREVAAQSAAQLLARSPWSHAAASLQIEALSQPDPMKGLDAYEAWLGVRKGDDAGLLEPIARAIVLQFAASAESDLRRTARRMLRDARVPLPGSDRDVTDQLDYFAARARSGDAAALKQLETVVAAGTLDPSIVARSLEAGGAATAPLLVSMLEKPSAPVRAAAAGALGRTNAESARPALQKMMRDPDPMVRSSAAVALARMGDLAGQGFVDQLLQSEVPEMRLIAAEAWNGRPGPWVAAITPLLDNRDGTVRLQAARLIAPVNPDAARRVLNEAAADPNPAIRSESARILEEVTPTVPDLADLAVARRQLRSVDATIRLHSAGIVLAAARAGT